MFNKVLKLVCSTIFWHNIVSSLFTGELLSKVPFATVVLFDLNLKMTFIENEQ